MTDVLPKNDDELLTRLGFIRRLIKIHRHRGVPEKDRMISMCMLTDPRPWRVQKLADEVLYSRSAVRETLNNFRVYKVAEEGPEGWVLTARGYDVLLQSFRESFEVAVGKRKNFSDDLYAKIEAGKNPGATRYSPEPGELPL